MLAQSVQAVDRVLVRLASALPEASGTVPAGLLRAAEQPLALRLVEVLLEAREARLVALRGLRELVAREVAERVLEQERVGEHLEQRGEGLQGLCHRVLQVLGGALWPKEHADEVGDGRAAEDDEGDLEEGLEAAFLHHSARAVSQRAKVAQKPIRLTPRTR